MAAPHQILLLLFSVAFLSVAARKSPLRKRSVIELGGAIECGTGRSLGYISYGCYCGLGGQGCPKDEADWCCFQHDCCYEKLTLLGCEIRTQPYHWTCRDHRPECEDPVDSCQEELCRCDQEIADCLRRAPYDHSNALWPDFLCVDKAPSCEDKSQKRKEKPSNT